MGGGYYCLLVFIAALGACLMFTCDFDWFACLPICVWVMYV